MPVLTRKNAAIEIVIVISVLLTIKEIADRLELIGAGSIAMWGGICLATVFMRRRGGSWRDRGLYLPSAKREWLKAIGYTFLIIFLSIGFMGIVLPAITEFLGVTIPESSADRFEFFLGEPIKFILFLIVVIWIGAALGEELLMRGFLLNNLFVIFGEKKIGKFIAIISHALFFGLLHISQGVPGIIGTGIVAIILGYVYLLNNRGLFPLILAHGTINSVGLIAYYLSDGKMI